MDDRAIGIFDSGLGGLTVVRELLRAMPNEDIVYFGDTGRVPYGSRSRETIERYAREDEAFLLSKNVKVIIAACGTVSSVAPHTGDTLPVPFIGVVRPAAAEAAAATKTGRIGVIGTTATINSGAYQRAIADAGSNAEVFLQDCPLFVPLVEAGWIDENDSVLLLTAERYLKELQKQSIDTLILGCTHYPLIAGVIQKIMGDRVTLINAGHAAATAAASLLCGQNMHTGRTCQGNAEFFVSDRTEGFSRIASLLLGKPIDGSVQHVDL